MTKFTVLACVAVFALGALVGRATVPTSAKAAQIAQVSPEELTRSAAPMPVQAFDAI